MNINKIISLIYLYAACILGTYYCIKKIEDSYDTIHEYSKYDAKTIGIIKDIIYKNITVEYNVNNIKYTNYYNLRKNQMINDKVEIIYKTSYPKEAIINKNLNNYYLNLFIHIIILIIIFFLIFIIVLFETNYNKYIHVFYAISITFLLSYYCLSYIYDIYNEMKIYHNIDKNIQLTIFIMIFSFIIIILLGFLIHSIPLILK